MGVVLATARHEVLEAPDVASARELLSRTKRIELVFCDVGLPGESGLELVRSLEGTDVAVVMLTGIDNPTVADSALAVGAYAYLVKPLGPNEVLINVASALKGGESRLLILAAEVALTHHERWDGAGYPEGLAGEEIPLSGRIVALADVFDALTSHRVYRDAMSAEEAIGIIEAGRGTQFDPDLVSAFTRSHKVLEAIRSSNPDITPAGCVPA